MSAVIARVAPPVLRPVLAAGGALVLAGLASRALGFHGGSLLCAALLGGLLPAMLGRRMAWLSDPVATGLVPGYRRDARLRALWIVAAAAGGALVLDAPRLLPMLCAISLVAALTFYRGGIASFLALGLMAGMLASSDLFQLEVAASQAEVRSELAQTYVTQVIIVAAIAIAGTILWQRLGQVSDPAPSPATRPDAFGSPAQQLVFNTRYGFSIRALVSLRRRQRIARALRAFRTGLVLDRHRARAIEYGLGPMFGTLFTPGLLAGLLALLLGTLFLDTSPGVTGYIGGVALFSLGTLGASYAWSNAAPRRASLDVFALLPGLGGAGGTTRVARRALWSQHLRDLGVLLPVFVLCGVLRGLAPAAIAAGAAIVAVASIGGGIFAARLFEARRSAGASALLGLCLALAITGMLAAALVVEMLGAERVFLSRD